MKKIIRLISAAIVSTAFMGGVASAATCEGVISVTGPSSTNLVNCNEINDLVVNCNNNIVTATVNDQNAASGNGDVGTNTIGGSVATGTALNDNGNIVTVGASCDGELAAVGGGGGGGGAPVEPESGVGEALPDTANTLAGPIAIVSAVVGAATIILSRIAVAAYRRSNN